MFVDSKLVWELFDQLNASGVRYALIKNINSELPDRLPDGKDIDILVHENGMELFERRMSDIGFKIITHPWGKGKGWSFAYGLNECTFWEKQNISCHFYIDVCEKLMCKSLTPNVWIPLDRSVNQFAWGHLEYVQANAEHGWWILSREAVFPYLIARCVFDKHGFPTGYITEIRKNIDLIRNNDVLQRLEKIFFSYTPRLISLLDQGRFADIFSDYITFANY